MLGVVGLVVGVIWIAAAKVRDSLKIQGVAEGILLSCTNMNTTFPRWSAGDGGASTTISSAAFNAGVLPKSWELKGFIKTPLETDGKYTPMYVEQWGNSYVGGSTNLAGATTLYFEGVTDRDCRNLLPQIAGRLSAMAGAGHRENLPISSVRVNKCNSYTFPNVSDCTTNIHYISGETSVDFTALNCGRYNIMRFVCNNSVR